MRIATFVLFVLALSLVACAQEVKKEPSVQVAPEVTIQDDASANQLEQTFDQGFDDEPQPEQADVNPDDLVY